MNHVIFENFKSSTLKFSFGFPKNKKQAQSGVIECTLSNVVQKDDFEKLQSENEELHKRREAGESIKLHDLVEYVELTRTPIFFTPTIAQLEKYVSNILAFESEKIEVLLSKK